MNTGAILNRINFGMALASGNVPGVRLQRWTTFTELAPLPRDQQVDGVVRALLGGDVSADMRAILLSGDHPMLGRAAARDEMRDSTGAPPIRATVPPPGLAQIVGLALGSPEFQRR